MTGNSTMKPRRKKAADRIEGKILVKAAEREKARKRRRGPYRKAMTR